MPSISIVVPYWLDGDAASRSAQPWANHRYVKEIIFAGVLGAEPITDFSAVPKAKSCVASRPSRGEQMNLGASLATGDTLLFHHVDSELTGAHLDAVVLGLNDRAVIGGGFYRQFDDRHPYLRWLERIERAHTRACGTIYGDQSVFVRREIFARLGGFAAIPLMEDVEFSRRLRRAGKVKLLDPPMRSSSQRQIEQGAWRVTLRNLLFLMAFRCGVSAEWMHGWYYGAQFMQPPPRRSRMAVEIPASE